MTAEIPDFNLVDDAVKKCLAQTFSEKGELLSYTLEYWV